MMANVNAWGTNGPLLLHVLLVLMIHVLVKTRKVHHVKKINVEQLVIRMETVPAVKHVI